MEIFYLKKFAQLKIKFYICRVKRLKMTLAFTGNRNVELTHDLAWSLHRNIEDYIKKGCDTMLFGLCYGSDFFFGRSCVKHKEKYPHIRLIGFVPHKGQEEKWSQENKKQYKELLEKCDEVIIVSEEYYPSCFQLRNMQMVNRADYLLSIYDFKDKPSGTLNTIKYAETAGNIREILIIKV